MAVKHAEFKTAYLQREVPIDAVVADQGLDYGALVTVTMVTATVGGVAKEVPVIARATSVATATHIIAQNDQTLIPDAMQGPAQRDYRVSLTVAKCKIADSDVFLGYFDATSGATSSNGKAIIVAGELYVGSSASPSVWTKKTGTDYGTAMATLLGNGEYETKHVALYPLLDKTDVIAVD